MGKKKLDDICNEIMIVSLIQTARWLIASASLSSIIIISSNLKITFDPSFLDRFLALLRFEVFVIRATATVTEFVLFAPPFAADAGIRAFAESTLNARPATPADKYKFCRWCGMIDWLIAWSTFCHRSRYSAIDICNAFPFWLFNSIDLPANWP